MPKSVKDPAEGKTARIKLEMANVEERQEAKDRSAVGRGDKGPRRGPDDQNGKKPANPRQAKRNIRFILLALIVVAAICCHSVLRLLLGA